MIIQRNIMRTQSLDIKPKSDGIPSQDLSQTNTFSGSSLKIGMLQIQSQLRKLKHVISVQKQLHNNRQQYQKVTKQIHEFQQNLKQKRKRAITQKIQSIEKRKLQRQQKDKKANQILSKIKVQNKNRRNKMESIIKLYKEQYQQNYKKNLRQKHQEQQLDLQAIKEHQQQYLKAVARRKSMRIKTENCHRYAEDTPSCSGNKRYLNSPISNQQDEKFEKIKELVLKRKEYGERVQRNASSVRVTAQMVRKGKNYKSKSGFDNNIDWYQNQKKKMEKPKLNTNFTGDVYLQQQRQIKKLAYQKAPAKDKLSRLKNLAEGCQIQLENGNTSALDKMSNINIVRANILLDY